ncbi:MAG: 4Fe-4S binding protein [Acidobacteriia bacterium]|nr:4Fe-4S binding protein [Terriglobia bacterium]
MRRLREFFFELFHALFRYYNFPSKLGLIRVGNPGEDSPVFLSGNYALTVKRLLRKLASTDCYLLVANSRGCNVWCAAGMNEFSEFDVIDAINVSGLKNQVRHRRIIAPAYAAPGVDIRAVKRETGFNIQWGPTHLNDLPEYITNGLKRTGNMSRVRFPFRDRLDLALATATAYAMTIALGLIIAPGFFGRVIALIFGVYLFSFCLYPLFPEERFWRRAALQAGVLLGLQAAVGVWRGWAAADFVLWGAVLLGVLLLLVLDECGSTPLHKTTLGHWLAKGDYRSLFSPVIDPELCINCMQCVLVCTKSVFAARTGAVKNVVAVRPDDCQECLACVKQCSADAIFTRSGKYKQDVKSVPNLEYLATRDWSHLRAEDRWLGSKTQLRGGIPVVCEPAVGSIASESEALAGAAGGCSWSPR